MHKENTYDEWLIYRIKTGDTKAYKLLIERWHRKLVKHIYYMVHEKSIANDIAQDTWMVVIKKLNTLKEPRYFKLWIFKISRNLSIDWIKKENKKQEYQNTLIETKIDKNLDKNIQDDNLKALKVAMAKLSSIDQQILNLFYLESCNIRDISHILDISTGTVKSRLFNARRHLKLIIKNNKNI